MAVVRKRLVECAPRKPGAICKVAHAVRARDLSERMEKTRGIATVERIGKIDRDRFGGFERLGDIVARGFNRHRSISFAMALARAMSRFWLDLSPPPIITINIVPRRTKYSR